MKQEFLRIGVIASAHGIRGEVKVYPTTDDIKRFENVKSVLMDTGKEHVELDIEEVKYFKNMVILKFKQFSDRNIAEKYKNKDLLVSRENAIPLGEDEYFLCDIIGAAVVTDLDEKLGIITEVLQTGANDVYVVKTPEGKEVLLPVIPQCVLDVDVEKALVKVHMMPGLI